MIAIWLGGTGMIGAETAGLFFIGLPALALGTWAGLKSFGRLTRPHSAASPGLATAVGASCCFALASHGTVTAHQRKRKMASKGNEKWLA